MSLLLSTEILSAIRGELSNAKESVQIITAFCKESTIKHLDACIDTTVSEKRVILRFRLDDILRGATDFSVLDYCIDNNWRAFLRFDLHAKTYIVDNKRGIVGSANVTNSGLNLGVIGNVEIATLFDLEPDDQRKIESLYRDAIPVDRDILEKMRVQFNDAKNDIADSSQKTWSREISDLFRPKVDTLFSHELPEKDNYQEGQYVDFLDDCYWNQDSLKDSFRWSNAYMWLLNSLEECGGCMYFGELSAKLHNALVTDPKPYRKDVKKMLANMLALITTLQMEEVIVDRPNYSQRVRLRETTN